MLAAFSSASARSSWPDTCIAMLIGARLPEHGRLEYKSETYEDSDKAAAQIRFAHFAKWSLVKDHGRLDVPVFATAMSLCAAHTRARRADADS